MNKERFLLNFTCGVSGTSLMGEFRTSFKDLKRVFGPPTNFVEGYKVSTEWIFLDTLTGHSVTLYDYKETSLYDGSLPSVEEFRELPSYDWHIGATSKQAGEAFEKFLQEKLTVN